MNYFARMKPLMLFGSFIMIVMLIGAVAFITKKNEDPAKHIEVVLRDVGHQLLLTARDSTSRVLPVRQLDENTYQLSFQNDISIISDSLINLVQREFEKTALATHYIVNLKNCEKKESVLAFEIGGKAGDLTPCRGRTLSTNCYTVEIELLKKNSFNFFWLLLLVTPSAFIGLYVKNKLRKKEIGQTIPDNGDYIQVGRFMFSVQDNVLKTGDKTIELSEKETKALQLFAGKINQLVERETLMKEIWEDKGLVVISRNVDVLVSKLRKKLADDNSIKIITVPGRGYKLMIE